MVFETKRKLDLHSKLHRTNKKRRKDEICDLCSKRFPVKHLLRLHRRTHFKDYTFKCDKCNFGTYRLSNLTRHEQVYHNGLRFNCDKCKKSFMNEYSYKYHVTTHDPNYIRKEYKCPVCSKVLLYLKTYKNHLKIHSGRDQHICEICGKCVTTIFSLRDHMMLHTGEKPYICNVCGKSFNKRKMLMVHQRVHTHEKPYSCLHCEKCFAQRSTLVIHIRRLCRQRKTKLRKPNIATTKVSSFKKDLYKLLFNKYRKKHDLKQCVILLGDVKNLNTNEFTPSKKLRRYLRDLNKSKSINTNSRNRTPNRSRQKTARLEESVNENSKSHSRKSSKHKNSSIVFAKSNSNNKKVVFEKNLVISDDSESETESYSVLNSSRCGLNYKTTKKPLENSRGDGDGGNRKGRRKNRSVTKVYDVEESIILDQPAKSVKVTDQNNDHVNKDSNKRGTSIIQLAFEKALTETSDVGGEHSTNETNATCTQEEAHVDGDNISDVNQKLMLLFGNSFLQQYKCTECKETFDDSFKLKRHTMVHKMKSDKLEKKPTHSCYLCMRKFCDRNDLWRHMRTHSSKQTNYKCKKCNIEFKATRDLALHSKICAGSSKGSNKNVAAASSPNDSSENTLKYRCNICKRKFADVLQMRRHKKLHNAQQLSTTGESSAAVTTSPRSVVLIDQIITTTASSKMLKNTTDSCRNITSVEKLKNYAAAKQVPEKNRTGRPEVKTAAQKEKTPPPSGNVALSDSSILTELKPKFKCCQQMFAERNQLFLHMKQVNANSGLANCNPVYVCSVCCNEFGERLLWYQHCKSRHKHLYGQRTNKSVVKIRKPRYACGTCYMKFDYISKLNEHKVNKHLSINSLQKTSARDASVSLNDLRAEFERLFCTQPTDRANQQDDVDINDDYDELIVLEDSPSDVSETESHKDNIESQKQCSVKLEDGEGDSSLKLGHCNEQQEANTAFDLSPKLLEQTTSTAVTYRCDICDDIFEEHEALLEHEAFHKEIDMPKKIIESRNTEQRKSLDMPNLSVDLFSNTEKEIPVNKGNPAASQQDAPINHININVVNNAALNQTLSGAISQPNVVTILIGNSAASIISPFGTVTQSPQSQKSIPDSNSNLNNESKKQGDLRVQPSFQSSLSANLTSNSADEPLLISDIRSLADSAQTLNQPVTNESATKNKSNNAILLNEIGNQTNPPPMRVMTLPPQPQKPQNNEERKQLSKNGPLNDNVNKAAFHVIMPERQVSKVADNGSKKTIIEPRTQGLNQQLPNNILDHKSASKTKKIVISRIKVSKAASTGSAPKTLPSLLTFTVPDSQKQMITKQASSTPISQTSIITDADGRPLENVGELVGHLVLQNSSLQIPTNQYLLLNQPTNLNQPASSHIANKVDTNSYYTVAGPQENSETLVSSFPQLAAVLTQGSKQQQISAATSASPNSPSALNTTLGAPAAIGTITDLIPSHKKSNKEKLTRSKAKLKNWFAEATCPVKILPKPTVHDVIVLSDDSGDGLSLPTTSSEKELPNVTSVSEELQTNVIDETLLETIQDTTYRAESDTIVNIIQEVEETLVTEHQTNSDNLLVTKDIHILTSTEAEDVSSVSLNNSSYLNAYENVSNPELEKSVAQIVTQPPRIFVRNIKDLMEPKTVESETEIVSQVSIDENQIGFDCSNTVHGVGINQSINSDSLFVFPAGEAESTSVSEQSEQEQTKVKKLPKFEATKCEDCRCVFKKQRSFRRHERIRKFKYRCHLCNYHTCSMRCVKLHYSSEHNIEHICFHCMVVCDTREDFLSHCKTHKLQFNSKNLDPASNKQIERETNSNIPNTDYEEAAQVAPELPVLYDELSVLEDTTVPSQDMLEVSEVPLVIDDSTLL